MKAKPDPEQVIDLRDVIDLRARVDAILLRRVDLILRQRVKRKRKLQPL